MGLSRFGPHLPPSTQTCPTLSSCNFVNLPKLLQWPGKASTTYPLPWAHRGQYSTGLPYCGTYCKWFMSQYKDCLTSQYKVACTILRAPLDCTLGAQSSPPQLCTPCLFQFAAWKCTKVAQLSQYHKGACAYRTSLFNSSFGRRFYHIKQ